MRLYFPTIPRRSTIPCVSWTRRNGALVIRWSKQPVESEVARATLLSTVSFDSRPLVLRTTVKASPLIARVSFLFATPRRFSRSTNDSFGNGLEIERGRYKNGIRWNAVYVSPPYRWLNHMKFRLCSLKVFAIDRSQEIRNKFEVKCSSVCKKSNMH